MREDLARIFPLLESASYKITSSEDVRYNCAAWAAGPSEIGRRWWPAPSPFYFWPAEPREETIKGFIGAFGLLGYAICDTSDLEPGYERLAIYADETNTPTHKRLVLDILQHAQLARPVPGRELPGHEQLAGSDYGRVVCFLKRKSST